MNKIITPYGDLDIFYSNNCQEFCISGDLTIDGAVIEVSVTASFQPFPQTEQYLRRTAKGNLTDLLTANQSNAMVMLWNDHIYPHIEKHGKNIMCAARREALNVLIAAEQRTAERLHRDYLKAQQRLMQLQNELIGVSA